MRKVANTLSLFALLVAFLASAAPAQALTTMSISGRAVDSVTNAPLKDVCITLGPPIRCWFDGTPNGLHTDALGNFLIDLTPLVPAPGSQWEIYLVCDAQCVASNPSGYATAHVGPFVVSGPYSVGDVKMLKNAAPPPPAGPCGTGRTDLPTTTVYLPNITKTLGGPSGWVTPFIVQNTGAATTALEISFYKFSDGSCVARRTVSALAPGNSFADIPNNDSFLPDDTQFAVVVKSFGANVVSTVNQVQGSGSQFQALAYTGVSTGATTAYLPNVTRRFFGYDIPFIIQNLGTQTATATSLFTSVPSSTCTTSHTYNKSLVIQSGRSGVIDPNFEATFNGVPGSGLADGCQYSVIVTSAQPIAVVANAHSEAGAPQAYSHNALTSGAATLYAPYTVLGGLGGRFSPVVVQNVGTSAASANLEFTPLGGGTAKTFSLGNINAGASRPFDPRYTNGDTAQPLCTAASATCLGNGEYSLRITSSGTIAAVALPVSNTTAGAYSAAPSSAPKSFLPNVTRTLGGSSGWTTPIVVQSVSATTVTLKWYRFSDGVLVTTQSLPMLANTAKWVDPRTVPGLSDDTQYAVIADGGTGTITAIVYEQNFSGGDGDMIYEGFPAQ